MPVSRAALLLVTLFALAGCASDGAFVDRDYMQKNTRKQRLPGYRGQVVVCFGDATPRAERDRMAAEACSVYGLEAMLTSETRWQCRMAQPHTANYACFDPSMRMANGGLVNPFSSSQVKAWQREQAKTAAPAGPEQQ